MRKRSLERQDSLSQYEDYINQEEDYSNTDDDTIVQKTSTYGNSCIEDYGFREQNTADTMSYSLYHDDYSDRQSIPNKQLPQIPMKNSLINKENVNDSLSYRGAVLPTVPTMPTRRNRILPQPQSKGLPLTPRMLPQMPVGQQSNYSRSRFQRSDTEYSDQESFHSEYNYRPGAVTASALPYNDDFNYAYQSTESLDITGGRRKGATLPTLPISSRYTKRKLPSETMPTMPYDSYDTGSSIVNEMENTDFNNYTTATEDDSYYYSNSYRESKSVNRKMLPSTDFMSSRINTDQIDGSKQLPQIPIQKKLPVVNSALASQHTSSKYSEMSLYQTDSTMMKTDIMQQDSSSQFNISAPSALPYNAKTSYNHLDKYVDKTAAIDDNYFNKDISTTYGNARYDDSRDFMDKYDTSSYIKDYGHGGGTDDITNTHMTSTYGSQLPIDKTAVKEYTGDQETEETDYYNDFNKFANYGSGALSENKSAPSTMSTMQKTIAEVHPTLSSISSPMEPKTTPVTDTKKGINVAAGLGTVGSIGSTITSSIGQGISKTFSSMFQSKSVVNQKSANAVTTSQTSTNTTNIQSILSFQQFSMKQETAKKDNTSNFNVNKKNLVSKEDGMSSAQKDIYSLDDEMNVPEHNTVDYTNEDYKYIYEDYSENDYIATGDIITSNNYNNYEDYTNSSLDGGKLMDSSSNKTNGQDAIVSILNNKNLNCDSTSANNVYNLVHNRSDNVINLNGIADKYDEYDQTFSKANSNNNIMNRNKLIENDSNNNNDNTSNLSNSMVMMNQQEQQELEVYQETYEEDQLAMVQASRSTTVVYNNRGLNAQYQSAPYYTYQEDSFNEEDEYRYLQKEQEEAKRNMHGDNYENERISVKPLVVEVEDEYIDADTNGYRSDDDSNIMLDINRGGLAKDTTKPKERKLLTQESISDTDFFQQHFEGTKCNASQLNKQESIMEEDESPISIENKSIYSSNTTAVTTSAPSLITSRPLSLLAAMTTTTTAQALSATKQPGDVSDIIGTAIDSAQQQQQQQQQIGGDATAMMMAAAKLATTATGSATTNKVDDVIDDINKKKHSIRSEADELTLVPSSKKSDITAKQRWNWAYNKIIMQLNVSTTFFFKL